MNQPEYDIRELTPDEPLRPDEKPLTAQQGNLLMPMNRAQRRQWAREHGWGKK